MIVESGDMSIDCIIPKLKSFKESTRGMRPLVTLSYAQSLDGCIAINRKRGLQLSGTESLKMAHELRAANDAILVGIGTILADNPYLTVRLVQGKNPRPVILDSHLRLPVDSNCLNPDSYPVVATTPNHDSKKRKTLVRAGVTVLCVPCDDRGWVNLHCLLSTLAELGIHRLMVEGGARVITSFLRNHIVDQLVVTIAPKLVGGLRAIDNLLINGNGGQNENQQPKLINFGYKKLGDDIICRSMISWEET